MAKRADPLGLRAATSNRLLPVLVGAMSFLASLALAGALAAAVLAAQWQAGAAAALTVQVTAPADPAKAGGGTRLQAVQAILEASANVHSLHQLSPAELDHLLLPWLGQAASQMALPLPAVLTATWAGAAPPDDLRLALTAAAPGTVAATGTLWASRVASLTASIQAAAISVLIVVSFVAAAVVAVVTRSGLAQGREAVEIVHGLGALDSAIAGRFAGRATWLAALGSLGGVLASLPVLLWLANLAAPFGAVVQPGRLPGLPVALWIALPVLPFAAALIGWCTTQLTVRGWLRRLA